MKTDPTDTMWYRFKRWLFPADEYDSLRGEIEAIEARVKRIEAVLTSDSDTEPRRPGNNFDKELL